MDHLSVWINNNQLIDQIGEDNLNELQTDIIDGVFVTHTLHMRCMCTHICPLDSVISFFR